MNATTARLCSSPAERRSGARWSVVWRRLARQPFAWAAGLIALAAAPLAAESPSTAPASGASLPGSALATTGYVRGQVRVESAPLPGSQVYAYQLADLSLRKVAADQDGRFSFESLPAGLYKIVAFKPGFIPGVALLTRASSDAAQFLEMELRGRDNAADSSTDFWSVRKQIPTDVLRDIDLASAVYEGDPVLPRVDRLSAQMRTVTGVDSLATAGGAQLKGGHVAVEGEIDDINVGVEGRFVALESTSGLQTMAGGHSQAVSVDVSGVGEHRIQVTSIDNRLRTAPTEDGRIGLASHRLAWSRDVGEDGEARAAAWYTEENNFLAGAGNASLLELPSASRTWNLEGNYTTRIGERSRLEAGVYYRDRDLNLADSEWLDHLPQERVEVFGRAGTSVHPSVLVEYGVYSTLRDGSVSLMPQGGVVVQLNDSWRAATSASLKMHDDPIEARRLNDFHTGYFRDYASCERAAAECYQLVLSKFEDRQEKLSISAIHRRFDESLRLHFDENFFNYHENLQLVHGDAVPELQFAMTQRLSPTIRTRLQSNLGEGGGGTLVLADGDHPYENNVRYMVTSVDTQFEQSATGVFVAFHHLEQDLEPLQEEERLELMDLQRLQLMLTQDLGILSTLASNWAVQLNMEVSRGTLPDSEADLDELRSRVTGGLAVKF